MHRTLLKTSSGFSNAHPTLSGWNQSRTVTDIPWYVYPDSTHMHFVDSRSPKRKFLIKLEKQAEASEKRRNVKPQRLNPSQLKPIELPTFIERGPTDVLRAMTLTLKKDYNAPDYKFHDDPYLTPYRAADKRDFVEAKEGGKVAARFVLQKHRDLFEKNLIEMIPHVKAFSAANTGLKVKKKNAGPRQLKLCIESCNVASALEIYEFMKQKAAEGKSKDNVDIFRSPELKQDFLELLCFHNSTEDEVMNDDYNLHRQGLSKIERKDIRKNTWEKNGTAEEIAEDIIANSPDGEAGHKARLALMIGKAKFNDFKGVNTLYQDIRNFGGFLNVEGYNAKLKAIAYLTDPHDAKKRFQNWNDIQDLLKLMNKEGIYPDRNTLNLILQFFRCMIEIDPKKLHDVGELDVTNIRKNVLSTLAEFKKLGIEPSLRGYADLSYILGKFPNLEILSRLEEVQKSKGTLINEVEDEECLHFFKDVMMQTKRCSSVVTATRIHQLVLNDPNSDVLLGGPIPQNEYYSGFLDVMLAEKPLNEFMEIFHTYVPHSFNPYYNTYEAILDSVIENGQPEHIPGLWMNYDVDHPFLGWALLASHVRSKNARILSKFCEAIEISNPFSAKAKENDAFSSIGKLKLSKDLGNVVIRIFDEFLDLYSSRGEMGQDSEIPDRQQKRNNVKEDEDPEQYDTLICQTLVKTSLDLGQYGLAKKVVDFCYDNFANLHKQKKPEVNETTAEVVGLLGSWATTLEYFTEVMIEENEHVHALKCVLFMDKQGHDVTQLAIQIGQKLKLDKKQKETLNNTFGRRSSWVMLEV